MRINLFAYWLLAMLLLVLWLGFDGIPRLVGVRDALAHSMQYQLTNVELDR